MLFNSLEFIFIFLPIVIAIYFILERLRLQYVAMISVIAASFFFYGYWNWKYTGLLAISISVNYLFGKTIERTKSGWITAFAIALNLSMLGYYKYTAFFLSTINDLLNGQLNIPNIILPLGISFFTFQQIAFLADVYQEKIHPDNFLHYCLFIIFFPKLFAGPIVHYKELVPQLKNSRSLDACINDLSIGLVIFTIGLFKKYAIADSLAAYADPIFKQMENLATVDMITSWKAILSYTFQIYFDFSGYSEMAIGLSRLFGWKLPLNFYSPYQSLNISEFWRRWHITLSRFLRDYLYIPLGGNKKGQFRLAINVVTVMFLGGLWHGAGWPFIIWGVLHGLFLVIHRSYEIVMMRIPQYRFWGMKSMTIGFSWMVTFLCVMVAWIFFRLPNVSSAIHMIMSLINTKTLLWPVSFLDWDYYIAIAFLIAICMPNCYQIMNSFDLTIDRPPKITLDIQKFYGYRNLIFKLNTIWATFIGFLVACIVLKMIEGQPTIFIYFQF
ncbi:MAG: MBOAT family protein [Desulfobacterales bacterium]|nr:MBOAT family protein [Desulfobacterales bacterium]